MWACAGLWLEPTPVLSSTSYKCTCIAFHQEYQIHDPLKLFAKNLEELKSRGALEDNFVMNDYVHVHFNVSVTESFSLTDGEILVTVCNVEE